MANKILQKVVLAIAGTALSCVTVFDKPAQAATIAYDFTVNITGGYLPQGSNFFGSFTYDDSLVTSQPGFLLINPSSFSFDFLNVFGNPRTYDKSTFLPGFPGILFQDGNLYGVNTSFFDARNRRVFTISGQYFDSSTPYQSTGTVSYSQTAQSVPEPDSSAATVLLLGLFGAGGLLKKRLASPSQA